MNNDVSDFDQLRKLARNAKYYVLVCSNIVCTDNFQKVTTTWSKNDEISWLIDLQCSICKKQWSVCCDCNNVKTGFENSNQIKQHQYKYHNLKRPNSKRKLNSNKKIINSSQITGLSNNINNIKTNIDPNVLFKQNESNYNIPNTKNQNNNINDEECSFILMNDDNEKIDEIFNNSCLKAFLNDTNSKVKSIIHSDFLNNSNPNEVNKIESNLVKQHINLNKLAVSTNVLELLYQNPSIHKLNKKTSIFYSYDLKSSGTKYLVSKMCGNISNTFTKISNNEVDYQIKMSRFVSTLTIRQQHQFALLLNDSNNLYFPKTNVNYNPVCCIPNNLACLRRMYTEGENAIESHLPIPDCIMVEDHSYISILDCIADTLLRNVDIITSIDNWDNVLSKNEVQNELLLFRCRRIKEIIKDGRNKLFDNKFVTTLTVIPIFISFWSDDFDPNRSIKANRQSVWIKTCTIFFMNDKGKKIENTYPIALSTKGSNHEVIECLIKKEINMLQTGERNIMYSRYHKDIVYVYGDIFCVMNDQPERRGNLKLANGNSICHGRFGFIIDCKQRKEVIRSCTNCSISIELEVTEFINGVNNPLLSYEWRNNTCNKCSAWMYNMKNKLLYYKPDKDYPSYMTDDDGQIEPQQINKNKLETALSFVHDEIMKGTLNTVKSKSILKYNGFNTQTQDMIVDCSINYKKYFEASKNKEKDEETYLSLQEDFNDDPKKYQKYTLPSSWYHFTDLKAHVDVPMHLLMLGVVKSVMLKIGIWLRFRSQKTMFLTMANNILEEIKALNLEWCKILKYPLTDKFGGWISENFLAMSRLGNWFYSLLCNLPESENYEDPNTPYNKWNKIVNQKWLEARGLSKLGTAVDIRNRVSKYFIEKNIPPIIVKNECKKENVLELVRIMCLMIQMLMSYETKNNNINKLDAVIRLFLIKYDVVDSGISEKDTPSWISQYNFLCLLNLPAMINNYGNVRNLWEGGIDGEGFLKRVKNELKPGLVNQWQRWSLVNLLKDKIYFDLVEDKIDVKKKTTNIRNECKIYTSRKKALEVICSGKPISGILIDGNNNQCMNNIFVCYRRSEIIKGIKIICSNDTIIYNNIQYFSIKASKEYINIVNCGNILVGVIFLPQLNIQDNVEKSEETKYCIVKSDWT